MCWNLILNLILENIEQTVDGIVNIASQVYDYITDYKILTVHNIIETILFIHHIMYFILHDSGVVV